VQSPRGTTAWVVEQTENERAEIRARADEIMALTKEQNGATRHATRIARLREEIADFYAKFRRIQDSAEKVTPKPKAKSS
jgi:hypothetical protein